MNKKITETFSLNFENAYNIFGQFNKKCEMRCKNLEKNNSECDH